MTEKDRTPDGALDSLLTARDGDQGPLTLVTLAQAIVTAHQRSFDRSETILRELRDQSSHFVDMNHYEARHTELDRRITVQENGLMEIRGTLAQINTTVTLIQSQLGALGTARQEQREGRARHQTERLTAALAMMGWLIAVLAVVLSHILK